jgi:hypothetical protein
VDPEKCADLKRKLAEKFGLPADIAPLKLLEFLYDFFRTGQTCMVASDSSFDLASLLKEFGIKTPLRVYIDWDGFAHFDEDYLIEMVKYFDYF